ncbi:MAG: prepilin-type N-terminal cleavage/methylation domain-containing protein [Phycisphaeraceae bacterium]|nr:prepilin-type N-terminal cleavage/methylation domain-containing protein [Phycisphaeraceae bacterium]
MIPDDQNLTTRRFQAFTLMEVLIVLAVLGIAAAMAVPLLGDTGTTKLRAAAQLLCADLAYAQVESIAHVDDLRFFIVDQANNTYSIAPASAPTVPITNPVGKQPYRVTFGVGAAASQLSGVTINAISLGGDDRIRFGPYGQLDQAANATITLAAAGHTLTVTIDRVTGETTIGTMN